jgi:plastocyanin domain-containing protein
MKYSLFKEGPIEVEDNLNENEEEADIDLHVESIIEKTSPQVAKIARINNNSYISNFKGFSRNMYMSFIISCNSVALIPPIILSICVLISYKKQHKVSTNKLQNNPKAKNLKL